MADGVDAQRWRRATVAATALLLLPAACTSDDPVESSSCEGGDARVSARSADGTTWRTTLPDPTDQTPEIVEGYVLVRHPCGYTVLDLTDGSVVRTEPTAGAEVLGIARGFVFVRTQEDAGVGFEGTPVVGEEVDDVRQVVTGPHPPDTLVQVLDGWTYVGGDHQLSASVPGVAGSSWYAVFPALIRPTIARVGEVLVVASADGSVYGVDRARGTLLWRRLVPGATKPSYELEPRPRSDLVDVVVFDRSRPYVLTLRAADGDVIGQTPSAEERNDPPLHVSGDGWVVRIDSDQVLHGMDGVRS